MLHLDELLDRLLLAIANRDLTATLACFTVEASILGSERGEELQGIDELRAFFERVYAKAGVYRFHFDERAWVLRKDVAWMTSNGVVTEPGQDIEKPYRILAIFEKQEADWRMALWCGTEPV